MGWGGVNLVLCCSEWGPGRQGHMDGVGQCDGSGMTKVSPSRRAHISNFFEISLTCELEKIFQIDILLHLVDIISFFCSHFGCIHMSIYSKR